MIEVGERAPPFLLGNFSLAEEVKTGPVLLVLCKISCPTCQFTLPFLNRLHERGLRVIGISQDDAAGTKDFTDHFKITFPVLRDAAGYPVSNAFKIDHVPAMFLVAQDGIISWSLNGFGKAELEKLGLRTVGSPFQQTERLPAMRPG